MGQLACELCGIGVSFSASSGRGFSTSEKIRRRRQSWGPAQSEWINVDLGRLSIEQRQTLFEAIGSRANMQQDPSTVDKPRFPRIPMPLPKAR